MPNALIFGVTGQDGAYLARLLLEKGYVVSGAHRRGRETQTAGLCELGIADALQLLSVDYHNENEMTSLIESVAPDEIYNLAAQSSVAQSFQIPVETSLINGVFVARLLEIVRQKAPQARFFQASSSEIFGAVDNSLLCESTPLRPRNPYGTSKAYAHHLVRNYREAFGLHASCGILFTHESPLRGPQFVSRKVTLAVARIKNGLQDELVLGNTDVSRAWGFAGEYVEAMWRMLQQTHATDFVIATEQVRTLRTWVALAFETVGLEAEKYLRTDAQLLRPNDSFVMRPDSSKAQQMLGWKAQLKAEELVKMMVEADMRRVVESRCEIQ